MSKKVSKFDKYADVREEPYEFDYRKYSRFIMSTTSKVMDGDDALENGGATVSRHRSASRSRHPSAGMNLAGRLLDEIETGSVEAQPDVPETIHPDAIVTNLDDFRRK